ncbi:winged helix-turn-helix domain-containing protein [Bilophila wadsworthia]|nr:winged helix-turn-helix domain-containing protein [Bilophila wadsworthia]
MRRDEPSLDMDISTRRRKPGDDPHNPAYLKTIRGMGYTLLPEEA